MNIKKTLLTLVGVLCTMGVWAGDTFTLKINGSSTSQTTANYFTLAGSTNSKYTGTYDGFTSAAGQKLDSGGSITFTTTAASTVIIVQSISSNGTSIPKFDSNNLSGGEENATNKVRVYTLTNVAAGTHTIKKGSGESGIIYVKVEYTGSQQTKLDTPTITADAQGNVTLAAGTNMHYTTDGSDPKATSTAYSAPFKVEDGTVVKAISIGDGTTTTNSDIASKTILIAGAAIATPVIKAAHGAVGISCATIGTAIKYSLNGGEYKAYTKPFVVAGQVTVKAVATREGSADSQEASLNVSGPVAKANSKTVYLSYGAFDEPQIIDGFSTLVGKKGNDAEGWKLVLCGDAKKNYSSGNQKIATGEKGDITSIKVSNGAQNKLVIPAGVKVNRVTIYSFINATTSNTACYWKEVAGSNYQEADVVLMQDFNDVKDYLKNPDVRVFAFDDKTGEITFNNAGKQLCFTMAVDYTTENKGPQYVTKEEIIKATKTAPAAGSEIFSNDMASGKTVYATTAAENKVKIGDVDFTAYMQVRVDAAPSAANPAGTEKSGSTPIIIKAEKDGDVTVYMRRQCVSQDCVAGDGKDVQMINQNGLAKVEGDLTISSFLDDKKEYAYCTETFSVKAGETYTLFARGTTLQVYGVKTSYKEEIVEPTYMEVDNGNWPIDYVVTTTKDFTTADPAGNRENGMVQFPEEEAGEEGGQSGDAATGINAAQVAGAQVVGIYSANGSQASQLQKGLNIVKLSNGKIVKVVK